MVFPFYWHYWSPTSDFKLVLNVSWSSEGDARSFGFWPLLYASNKFGWAVPFLLTFNVGDSKIGNQYGALLGLYWWKRSQKGAIDFGLVPPYVSSRDAAHAFTWVAPLNFYWRNGQDSSLLALPLFYKNEHRGGNSVYTWLGYSRREGREQSGSALWLYWFGRDDANKSRYDVLFPLLWSFRGADSSSTVLFPLIWSFSGPKTNTTVAGLFIHRRNDAFYANVLFPVWWSVGDDATGRGFKAFIPLFVWKRDFKARTSSLFTAAGGYSKDETNGTLGGLIWPVLTFWYRDPTSSTRVITPLYVSHWSKTEHSMTRWVALLFYQREDPAGSTTMFFPFVWRFKDAATGATATVTPLGGHRSGPRDDTTVVLTVFWRTYKPGGWSAGLFPLLFFGNKPSGRHAVVFPLFWHLASETESTTTLVPLFYWHRDRDGYAFGTPLLFLGNDRGDSYAIQFPLIWHFASERRGTSTTVVPVGYYHKDPDGWSLGVGPLVPLLFARSGKTRSHFALVPLIWHFADRTADRTTTVVGPYWHRRWGNETTDGLFPLLYYRRGARPGGSDETSFTFFPLVHYRRDAHTSVFVTPLGATARGPERSGGFLGPYFWYDDKERSLRFIPFLHIDVTDHATGERTRQYGPWFQVDAPKNSARALIPLFARYKNEQETGTWVLPTFFRMRRNNGDRVDALLPLYWRSAFGDRRTTLIGLYYDRTAPGVHNFGFAPLFFYARNPERTITVIPPLLTVRRDEGNGEKVWQWTLLYAHKHDRDTSLTTVFPLFWSYKREGRTTAVGFPLYWHVADEKENRSWTYVAPLAFWSRSGTWRTRGILTAWYTRDSASGYASQAFLPLFYQASGPDHFSLLTLVGGYRHSGPSRLWYLTPLVWSTDSPTSSFSMVFPLWFRRTDKMAETTTTVAPLPFLYVSRTTPATRFQTTLGLYWHYRDIASSTRVVLPLFYDVHEYQVSRTTAVFPLFVRRHIAAEERTYWVSPFFYSHTSPTYSTTFGFPLVFVPLYWDIRRGDNRTTAVLPLFYKWRRPSYQSTLVVPFYYHQEGLRPDGTPDGTDHRFVGVVLPVYESAVKRPGDFMWRLLLGLVGGERIGHHRYLRLFWFFDVELESAPKAQTAWYSKPAPAPRKMAARGLDVAGF